MNRTRIFVIAACIIVATTSSYCDTYCDKYPYITHVFVGPMQIDEKAERIHYHRIVVTVSEIYTNIYVERLSADEEMMSRKVVDSYNIPAEKFNNSDQTGEFSVNDIELVEWRSYGFVRILLDEAPFEIEIKENLEETVVVSL